MQSSIRVGFLTFAAMFSVGSAFAQSAPSTVAAPKPAARETMAVWAFKPKQAPYIGPNRPVWHIAEIVAQHKGHGDWVQPVVKDPWFLTQYVAMPQGKKTATSFQTDTTIWFVVQSGQIRFTIKGQEPFVASKDFIVQIPMRTPYSMETVGDVPSIRLEVRVADGATAYPVADNPQPPTAPPGYEAVKVNFTAPSSASSPATKTALDFDKEVINSPTPPTRGANFFVRDSHGFAVPIRSAPTAVPPGEIGHFHTDVAEFWYVLEGEMDVRIEGVPGLVHGQQGDIIYAPVGRYHRTIMTGSPMSTRLAMGGITDSGASFTPYTEK